MKERGDECPIDGVGFQNHMDITYSDENIQGIKQNVERYALIGVEVQFTETDVRCNQFGNQTCNFTGDWSQDALDRQAEIYGEILKICLNAPNCMNYESWGFTDKYTFLDDTQKAFPLDSNYNGKKAYDTMI